MTGRHEHRTGQQKLRMLGLANKPVEVAAAASRARAAGADLNRAQRRALGIRGGAR